MQKIFKKDAASRKLGKLLFKNYDRQKHVVFCITHFFGLLYIHVKVSGYYKQQNIIIKISLRIPEITCPKCCPNYPSASRLFFAATPSTPPDYFLWANFFTRTEATSYIFLYIFAMVQFRMTAQPKHASFNQSELVGATLSLFYNE